MTLKCRLTGMQQNTYLTRCFFSALLNPCFLTHGTFFVFMFKMQFRWKSRKREACRGWTVELLAA